MAKQAVKCHNCYHRLESEMEPACVPTCPSEALWYRELVAWPKCAYFWHDHAYYWHDSMHFWHVLVGAPALRFTRLFHRDSLTRFTCVHVYDTSRYSLQLTYTWARVPSFVGPVSPCAIHIVWFRSTLSCQECFGLGQTWDE